jgi:hypothetical protein
MKKIFSVIVIPFLSSLAFANPNYNCHVGYVKRGTMDNIKTEDVVVDYQGFVEACSSGKCLKQDYIIGGKVRDPQIVALISHREEGHNTSTMLIDLKLGPDEDYIQSSLAGSDFGNRVYTQVSTMDPNIEVYINCLFNP